MSRSASPPISTKALDAVLFDMDGVVTDTAEVHAGAWKRLFDEYLAAAGKARSRSYAPFDAERDYRTYVDGKPRYDGVRSFLESRGINLPEGAEDDPPEAETIRGLGNRKNQYFRERLAERPPRAFASTENLIRALRATGMRVAVFSASRNAGAVLARAGIASLFDANFDGNDLAAAGLPGKPDPAMLLEAARSLGVNPANTAVVEDAVAGVEAAVRGAFGLIVGIARARNDEALRKAGAHLVVHDASELAVTSARTLGVRTLSNIPAARDRDIEIRQRLAGKVPAAFLDYDGTLTPIVEDYTRAFLSPEMRATIASLAKQCTVAIVSGRDLEVLQRVVGLDGIHYAGSHGFQIAGPGGTGDILEKGLEYLPALDAAEHRLRDRLADIPGHAVERKRFSIAVHYRRASESNVPRIEAIVDDALGEHEELRKEDGKKVFEIRPNLVWDKGHAVLWLLDRLGLDEPGILPIYVGDDITDEDAFRALSGRGLTLVVREAETDRPTAADYTLADTEEVKRFLELVKTARSEGQPEADRGEARKAPAAVDAWHLVYDGYRPDEEGLREALCTLGNGCFATRGAAPDCEANGIHYPGTYLAGGYNRLTTRIDSRQVENEDLVNLPNWLPLTFRIDDGDWFRLDTVEILSYRQDLDLRRGVLERTLRFRDARKRTTRWTERRLVSMADPHAAGMSVQLFPENWSGRITVRSGLDGSVTNGGVERYKGLASRHLEVLDRTHLGADMIFLRARTNQSLTHIALLARTRIYREDREIEAERRTTALDSGIEQEITCEAEQGRPLVVEKLLALYSSIDQAISEPGLEARRGLSSVERFDDLLPAHTLAWKHLWQACDIALEDGARRDTELKLRVHIFHLLQTVSMHTVDRDVGVPARGWHGEAYRGHIFWDEIFVFPFLTLRVPTLTRALLLYRYRRLPAARRAAREIGCEGAMYPWQSGSDGREESQRYHLNPQSGRWIPDNTHRQRHINAAIAYNIWQYHQATDDHEFLYSYGAEMLLEIARFWASIATYNPAIDRYEIKGVMGPDEYHTAYPGTDPENECGVDNNAYTNVMAAWVLNRARDVLDLLPRLHCEQLCERLGFGLGETERWLDISRKLRVPFHDGGIIGQFDGYDALEELDWPAYEAKYGDIQRLDRILEAEGDTTNRYKVSKQADVLMLFYLFSADELALLFEQLGYPFDRETIPRNIEYYLARTSHGSTLSRIVNSWIVARSDRPRSWRQFQAALDSDIADIQGGTTREGIHIGAMAGTIDLVQRCFLGVEMRTNALHFDPALPTDLPGIKVRLRYRRQILDVEATHDRLTIMSRPFPANPITVAYRGHYRNLAPGDAYEFPLLKPEDRNRDENIASRQKS